MLDPREKNKFFNTDSIQNYSLEYAESVRKAVSSVDGVRLENAFELMAQTFKQGGHIYTAGNGGSAAICDHLCCDWSKGTFVSHKPALKSHSLVANNSLLTALANDFGYENALSKQVEMFLEPKDLLILISSSGNSHNIINALKQAKQKGVKVLGFAGFEGGELDKHADICLYVSSYNYGVVEDSHQMLMHILAQYFYLKIQK